MYFASIAKPFFLSVLQDPEGTFMNAMRATLLEKIVMSKYI
jgi:hypothetical protein